MRESDCSSSSMIGATTTRVVSTLRPARTVRSYTELQCEKKLADVTEKKNKIKNKKKSLPRVSCLGLNEDSQSSTLYRFYIHIIHTDDYYK